MLNCNMFLIFVESFCLQQNELHGWLNLTSMIFEKFEHAPLDKLSVLRHILFERSWLAVLHHNPCPFTASLYLDLMVFFIESNGVKNTFIDGDQLVSNVTSQASNVLVSGFKF